MNYHQRVGRPANDLVLLALDGGDDVSHVPRASAAELGQQGIGHAAVAGRDRVGIVEVLFEDVQQAASVEGEAAPETQTERVSNGRSVERRRHRSSPIDHDGLVSLVLYVATAYVVTLPVILVDAPEAEWSRPFAQRVKAGLEFGSDDRRVDLGGPILTLDQPRGDDTHRVETRVSAIDVSLFRIEIWMGQP